MGYCYFIQNVTLKQRTNKKRTDSQTDRQSEYRGPSNHHTNGRLGGVGPITHKSLIQIWLQKYYYMKYRQNKIIILNTIVSLTLHTVRQEHYL